jgi:LCP family protein required for cell wall assembly
LVANVISFVCLAAVASIYGYVRYELGRIATSPVPNTTPEGQYANGGGKIPTSEAPDAGGLKPENILLIGNETRQGLTPYEQQLFGSALSHSGTLADIIMILHLDPATDTASLLSIPRDLFVPMPAGSIVGSFQKVDAALNNGPDGPNNLIAAIQEDFGIPVNHFVELNFNGLINVINAIGGINVYFPYPVFDAYSLLDIPTPGCHHLNGFYALSLVRARHLQYEPPGMHAPVADWPYDPESDLARIERTHTFLRIVADKVKKEGLADPAHAFSFINAIVGDIRMDQGLKGELVSLVVHYRHINVNAVPELTLPTTPVNNYYYDGYDIGDVLFPVEPVDLDTIKRWDPSSLPTPRKPSALSVVSIAGSDQAAASAAQALATDGLHVTSSSAGPVPASMTETYVVYHPGQVADALYVMRYLSGPVMLEVDPSQPPGTVEVQLGNVVSVTAKPAPMPSSTTSATASSANGAASSSAPTSPAEVGSKGAGSPAAHAGTPTTTVPTPGGIAPSPAAGIKEPWDPRACPGKS